LRKYILENALIKEIIDFGETKIFEGAPGQHNMVFILEKCPSGIQAKTMVETPIQENIIKKEKNQIKIVKVKEMPIVKGIKPLKGLIDHIEKHIDKKEYSDDYIDVFYSAVRQEELTEQAWNLKYTLGKETILNKIERLGEKSGSFLHVGCGVLTNRDYVAGQNIKRLTQSEIEHHGIKLGDGIFVLSEQEYLNLSLSAKEKKIVKPWHKNSEVTRYIPDPHEEKRFLIYLRNKDDLDEYSTIKSHLLKFKGILDYQLIGYGESNKWYAVTRTSEDSVLKREKIFTPYRQIRNTFAYIDADFFSSKDLYYITYKVEPPTIGESLKYILSILNSAAIDFWCMHKLKRKGNAREYYATPLKQIPIRRIDFSKKDEVKTHDTLVKKVETMIETKKRLAEFNNFFKTRLTRLEDPKDVPEPDAFAITRSLPASDLRVLRTHPKVQIEAKDSDDFYLAKAGEIKGATLFDKSTEEAQYSMKLVGKNKKEIAITAPKEIIYYLKEILKDYLGKSLDEIKKIPLAKDLETYEAKRNEILKEVKKLLTKAKSLQAEIDEIVYELYGITQAERKIIEKELQSR